MRILLYEDSEKTSLPFLSEKLKVSIYIISISKIVILNFFEKLRKSSMMLFSIVTVVKDLRKKSKN